MSDKPDFKARNTLLIKALLGNKNPDDNVLTIGSKLFELMTGRTLYRDTDVINGEDFYYKCGEQECMASVRFHPEVAHWFGWFTNSLHSTLNHRKDLIMLFNDKIAFAEALKENFEEFQLPTPCMDRILLNDAEYMVGDNMYGMFEKMTGAAFYIHTDAYDKESHAAYHDFIESGHGSPLNGTLTFMNSMGIVTDSDDVKSLYYGDAKRGAEQYLVKQ
jgi:hypothetical protein